MDGVETGESLTVEAGVLAEVRAHAIGAAPEECCGALLGRGGEVVCAVALENEAVGRDQRYLITAPRVLRVEAEARRRGLEVVGYYHSHPDGAPAPSETDRALAWPGYAYLIVGGARIEGWRLREDRSGFLRVRIVTRGEE